MPDLTQILPRNPEAERAVLSALISNPYTLQEVVPLLGETGEMFYDPAYGRIYQAVVGLDARNVRPEAVTLVDHLRNLPGHVEGISTLDMVGGPDVIYALDGSVVNSAYARQHAEIVRRDHVLRRLIYAGGEIARLAYAPNGAGVEEIIGQAEQLVYGIRSGQNDAQITDTSQVAQRIWQRIQRQIEHPGQINGWKTGIPTLDHILRYIDPGRLVTIAGRPGMGKTATALQIARNMALRQRNQVLFFPLEMSEDEMLLRMIGSEINVDGDLLKEPHRLTPEQVEAIHQASGIITTSPFKFGKPGNLPYMRAVARRWASRLLANGQKPAAIFIDYLQLIPTGKATSKVTRDQQVGEITRELKLLAQELQVVVFIMAQLNRELERRSNHRPILSDLRESGSIEQDSDIVIFTYLPHEYASQEEQARSGSALAYELIVGKWRAGKTGAAYCLFDKATGNIVSAARQQP